MAEEAVPVYLRRHKALQREEEVHAHNFLRYAEDRTRHEVVAAAARTTDPGSASGKEGLEVRRGEKDTRRNENQVAPAGDLQGADRAMRSRMQDGRQEQHALHATPNVHLLLKSSYRESCFSAVMPTSKKGYLRLLSQHNYCC